MTPTHRHPQKPAETREKGATPKGHGAKPDAVRETAILALLTEKSIALAAERCGVNERTLRRWLAEDEAFKAEYDAARKATYQAGIARIQALAGRGVETLEELLDAKKFPAVRLGAARTLVELGIHQHDADSIMRKLEEIETAQRGRG
jgi:hypothetical protein